MTRGPTYMGKVTISNGRISQTPRMLIPDGTYDVSMSEGPQGGAQYTLSQPAPEAAQRAAE